MRFKLTNRRQNKNAGNFFFHFVLPSCCYFVNSSRKHPQCQCIGTEKKVFRKHFTIFDGNLNPVLKYRSKQKSNEWDTKEARERKCSASSEIHALKLVWSISNGLSNIACMCVCVWVWVCNFRALCFLALSFNSCVLSNSLFVHVNT